MDAATATSGGLEAPPNKRAARTPTTVYALSHDILCLIFSVLDLLDLVRCAAVCKSWKTIIVRSKLVQSLYCKQQKNSACRFDVSASSESSFRKHILELAMDRHRLSLQEGPFSVFQWKGHSVGVDQCLMKAGLILTGVGDKVMRLWSAEKYKCLDEYSLPDGAPLVDFDFDESKVVGLIGTRIGIWRRNEQGKKLSSFGGSFTKGLCMRYVDPEVVVGCEDGTARVFDMYSRSCSKIIRLHAGPVTCLALSDDQLIISGSSLGNVRLSDLSSDQEVAALRSTHSGGIRTLCFNPCSNLVFAGSTSGYSSCWDIRTMRTLWCHRVSPNVIYSINHLRGDTSTLVVGGIDGVLRFLDQETGEVLSRCIMDENSSGILNLLKASRRVVQIKKVKRLSEDTRIDLIPKTCRPPIRCLAVGMQKVVTTHSDKYIRVWKFGKAIF